MPKGKYQEWLTKDGLLQITGWARNGLNNNQIANNIGISRDTLYKWMRSYPQIEEALKEGRRPLDVEIENALIKKALGFTDEEETTEIKQFPDGKQEVHKRVTKKVYPPDTGAIAFYLKNRAANRYSDHPKLNEELNKLILENEKLRKDNELKDLEIEKIKRELKEDKNELSKVDTLLKELDNAAFKDAE